MCDIVCVCLFWGDVILAVEWEGTHFGFHYGLALPPSGKISFVYLYVCISFFIGGGSWVWKG